MPFICKESRFCFVVTDFLLKVHWGLEGQVGFPSQKMSKRHE